jgi:hypothetical protein
MQTKSPSQTIGYLLTRERHCIPIAGLCPEQIKPHAKAIISSGSERIGRAKSLDIIPKRMGFKGNWGTYQADWPALKELLDRSGCKKVVGLFPKH